MTKPIQVAPALLAVLLGCSSVMTRSDSNPMLSDEMARWQTYAWLPTPADGVPARGRVTRARFIGNQSIVELAMDHDGSTLKATIPGVFLPKPGTPLWLSLRRDRCFVFPCRVQSRLADPYVRPGASAAAE